MQSALRRVATSVVAMATLGCASDHMLAPAIEWSATTTPPAAGPPADSLRAGVLPDTGAAGLLSNTPGANRNAREQLLGFQYSPESAGCVEEGDVIGHWRLRFSGYGCVGVSAVVSGNALTMQPQAATANEVTHASLMLGPEYRGSMVLTTRLETTQQLRRNAAPNAWEVAWVLWQYQDDEHFYYFIPKPNGWEVGKRDPAYPGGQRFLATGTDRTFPLNQAVTVQIAHVGNAFTVTVDGVLLTTFTDEERPYVAGRIALYSEDAAITVHKVSVRSGAL